MLREMEIAAVQIDGPLIGCQGQRLAQILTGTRQIARCDPCHRPVVDRGGERPLVRTRGVGIRRSALIAEPGNGIGTQGFRRRICGERRIPALVAQRRVGTQSREQQAQRPEQSPWSAERTTRL